MSDSNRWSHAYCSATQTTALRALIQNKVLGSIYSSLLMCISWRLVSSVRCRTRSVPAASHEIRVATGPGPVFDLQVPKAHLVFKLKRSSTIDYHSSKLQFEAPSLHFVLIFLAPPRRQPARAMNSHDRRPGPSPSLGSSVAQAGRAVKQGFELGTGTALQIARLS